jgi:hypothetical protein
MTEQFGFKSSELVQIENFMNQHNQKTAKEILDYLVQDNKLNNKQKIVTAYIVGNSARDAAIQEDLQKGIIIDVPGSIPPVGG